MVLVIGKCKFGHDTPDVTEGKINGKVVPATLCSACLISLDTEVNRNAGRVMHADRYTTWTTKNPI